MFKTKDVGFVNAILNHPDVLPYVALPGQDSLDASPLVEPDENIVLGFDGGCFIFVMLEPGLYEVHTQFLPDHRGRHALRCARQAAEEMFLATECMEIVTKVPEHNQPAKGLTKLMQFDLEFSRGACYPTKDGLVGCEYYSLPYSKWAKNVDMSETGKWFHDGLVQEKARLGMTDHHPDDEEHDKRVGMAVSMALRGQPEKAEWLYNRWARFAGYETIELVGINPLVVDIKEAIVKIDDKIEVLKCLQAQH